jgi:EAL domain-containing protein (putative c-di-GMP-specific phosphodiesterase class I)/putative methionine-R-sulfoxide reductase with GAF domain
MTTTAELAEARRDDGASRATIEDLCLPGRLAAVVQPIVRLTDMVVVGYEALTRVTLEPVRGPDWWLEQATGFALRSRLETACWEAIAALGEPPEDRLLFVNVSPSTLAEPGLLEVRSRLAERLVVEVTEQEAVGDYSTLRDHLAPFLASPVRLAIDDTGAGYSSLRHVIELVPDFLKLDRGLVSGIDQDRNRLALVRSLVAFAREVGTSVIAEGIERPEELDTLRTAGVSFGQGYLLARPGPAWPELARPDDPDVDDSAGLGRQAQTKLMAENRIRLRRDLAAAVDAGAACEAVVDHLFEQGQMMPSLYLERHGQLRCISQRGLWQVLDGLSHAAGVTGRTWANNEPTVVERVTDSPDYLEAIPGVVAEICVPIVIDGRAIGSLNVESLSPLPTDTLARLRTCAQLLARRLSVVGHGAPDSAWQRTARASAIISRLLLDEHTSTSALRAVREASLLDSACLIRSGDDGLVISEASGPLADAFAGLAPEDLASLTNVVDNVSSCYTAGETTGRGFVGAESLRASGARAVVVLPIRANSRRLGTVVLAHARPIQITAHDVEPLELLVSHLAATLATSELLADRSAGTAPRLH